MHYLENKMSVFMKSGYFFPLNQLQYLKYYITHGIYIS